VSQTSTSQISTDRISTGPASTDRISTGQASAFAEPGQRVSEGKGRIFPCPSCGADLEFHIGQQNLTCPYCGYGQSLTLEGDEGVTEQDFSAMLDRLVELRREGKQEHLETQEVQCDSCGATVEFTGSLTSTHCAYCGSPIQRENVHRSEDRIPVDGVLPFQVERAQAQENLRRWLGSLWFAPDAFKKQGAEGNFSGVYLPFWTFDAMTSCRYRGQRGDHYQETRGMGDNRRRIRKTRWTEASGNFQRFFDDVLVAANRSLPRSVLLRLEPWPLERTLPFTEEALAGYLAQAYEIPLDEGFPDAKGRVEAALRQDVARRIGGATQRVQRFASRFSAITYKHLLLPVWLMSYRYKGKPYQVVINAASGQVFGDRPYSPAKITFLVLLILFVLFFVVL